MGLIQRIQDRLLSRSVSIMADPILRAALDAILGADRAAQLVGSNDTYLTPPWNKPQSRHSARIGRMTYTRMFCVVPSNWPPLASCPTMRLSTRISVCNHVHGQSSAEYPEDSRCTKWTD
jgi:hypothetical protein